MSDSTINDRSPGLGTICQVCERYVPGPRLMEHGLEHRRRGETPATMDLPHQEMLRSAFAVHAWLDTGDGEVVFFVAGAGPSGAKFEATGEWEDKGPVALLRVPSPPPPPPDRKPPLPALASAEVDDEIKKWPWQERTVHRARGIYGETRSCPQCKAGPGEPCLFGDLRRHQVPKPELADPAQEAELDAAPEAPYESMPILPEAPRCPHCGHRPWAPNTACRNHPTR